MEGKKQKGTRKITIIGLSTRYWSGHAARIVGVDPNQDMLNQAKERAQELHLTDVSFMQAYTREGREEFVG
jgi:ubiquinone/menaquinone biosynthesis C-methylase UbiE